MKRLTLALIFAVTLPMNANASGSLSAADMLKSCERDDGFCIAYVTAIMDLDERDYLNDEDTHFCLPDRARLADIKGTIVRYLHEHSEVLGEPFVEAAIDGLRQGYPCERSTGPAPLPPLP